MAREKNEDLDEDFSEDEIEELEDDEEDELLDKKEDDLFDNVDIENDYGAPMPEEKHNAHTILDKAIERRDSTRTTFLTESELGRPVFSVRFLSDLEDDAKRLNLVRIENYYHEKIQNVTGTGMSNKGFAMNLNVTQKRDTVRKRIRDNPNAKEVKK